MAAINGVNAITISRQVVRRLIQYRWLAKKYDTTILKEIPDGRLFLDFLFREGRQAISP